MVSIGSDGGAGEGKREQEPRGARGHDQSGDGAADGEQHALHQRLGHDLPSRRPHGQPHGGLSAARHRAGQQQVGHVSAGDEQHQRAHGEQDLQAAPVLLLHHAHTRAGGHHRDHLLRQRALDLRHPVRRIAGLVPHPLPEQPGEPRVHAVDGRARTQPADHAQPRRDGLAQQRRLAAGDQRLLLQRHPQVRRIGLERLAEEAGRRDAGHGERIPLDHQRGPDDRGVAAVDALPGVIGHHHDGDAAGLSSSAENTRPVNAFTPSVLK